MKKIIIFPTDTVYALSCSIYDIESLNKIYLIKEREKEKKIAVLVSNIDQIEKLVYLTEIDRLVINKFMPGALTLICKTKESFYKISGYNNLGIRIPNSKIALDIINEYGPMFATSVNKSGCNSINDYNTIYNLYKDKVDYIYKDKCICSCVASTVIDTCDNYKLLREGSISYNKIKDFINNL